MRQLLFSFPPGFSPSCMASILKVLLGFLRLAGNYVLKFPGRRASLLAFIGRKFKVLWCFWLGKLGMLRRPKPPDLSKASTYSVSGTSAVLREDVVAASVVPGSAICQERAEWQVAITARAPGTSPQTPTNVSHSVDHAHNPNPSPPSDRRIIAHLGSGDLSTIDTQSSGGDRFSVVRDSANAIHDQLLRLSTATHFQFGHLPDPSQSGDRLSRLPSPTNPPPSTLYQLHRSRSTDLPSLAHGDTSVSLINRSSISFFPYEPLGPRPIDGNHRGRSSASMVLNLQNLSNESAPIPSSVYPPRVTAEPFDTDTATAYSSPDSTALDLHGEAPIQYLNNVLPEGRFVQLINSDQVPRYTKNITM